jgi:putative aldouronate transport system permease protein
LEGTQLGNGYFSSHSGKQQEVGFVLDTYVYYKGIQQSDFIFTTAVGLFKGVVGLVLIVSANYLAKKMGEEGLY